jgi:hypothetical protein
MPGLARFAGATARLLSCLDFRDSPAFGLGDLGRAFGLSSVHRVTNSVRPSTAPFGSSRRNSVGAKKKSTSKDPDQTRRRKAPARILTRRSTGRRHRQQPPWRRLPLRTLRGCHHQLGRSRARRTRPTLSSSKTMRQSERRRTTATSGSSSNGFMRRSILHPRRTGPADTVRSRRFASAWAILRRRQTPSGAR